LSWKSKPAKKCVTTYLPNGSALKIDGARAYHSHPAVEDVPRPTPYRGRTGPSVPTSRRTCGSSAAKPAPRGGVQRPVLQILVVVASTQARTLRAEVEQGFLRTAFGQELVDPKVRINLAQTGRAGRGGSRSGGSPSRSPPGAAGRGSPPGSYPASRSSPPRHRKGIGSTFPNPRPRVSAVTRPSSGTSSVAPRRVLFSR